MAMYYFDFALFTAIRMHDTLHSHAHRSTQFSKACEMEIKWTTDRGCLQEFSSTFKIYSSFHVKYISLLNRRDKSHVRQRQIDLLTLYIVKQNDAYI